MQARSFRANATEINKNPAVVRYVFILKLADGRDYVAPTTTYRTLKENTTGNALEYLKVVDLQNNTVSEIRLNTVESLLDEWRDNYFNTEWDIPMQFTV